MMQVKVLQHHIDEGKRFAGTECAVALAVREAFPESTDVHVGGIIIVNMAGNRFMTVPTPPNALTFIKRFDNGYPVEPFTFELDYAPSKLG